MINIYDCKRCGFSTKSSQNLKLHFKRKTMCAPILSNVEPSSLCDELFGGQPISEKKYMCEYCKKSYASVESRCNHKKICKKKIEHKVSSEEKITQQQKLIEEQQKRIDELESREKVSAVTVNIQNIETQNVTINAFGQENLAYLTSSPEYKKFMTSCFDDHVQGILNLTDAIYYNKDHPENHNIKKSNKKDNHIKVYDGTKWQTRFAKDTAETIFEKINHELMEFLKSMQHKRTPIKNVIMKKFMELVGNALGYDFSMFRYKYECNKSEKELGRRKQELIALEMSHINERTKENI